MRQADIFMGGEGAAWLKRNINKLSDGADPVCHALVNYKIRPERVVEIGCANGWRLEILKERGWSVAGVEPGLPVEYDGYILRGTADDIPFKTLTFDLVIYGWCLYLCDPEDYFKIVAEGDRVLDDGGHILIYDFYTQHPHKNKYKHKEGLFSYKMDFSKLWLGHPAYCVVGRTIMGDGDSCTAVTILKKNMKGAFK